MTAKISGIKIPVTIDSSGVDAGLNNLKSKLSGNIGTQTTLSTGTGSQFGAGPLGGGFSKGPVGSGLMGAIISAGAARAGTSAAVQPFVTQLTNTQALSLAWARSGGAGGRVHTFSIGPQPGSPKQAPPTKPPASWSMTGAATQLLGGDFAGLAETIGAGVGMSVPAVGLAVAGGAATIYAGKKIYDFNEAMMNANASFVSQYRKSDPYYGDAWEMARRANMTTPSGKGDWLANFGLAAGSRTRAGMSLVGAGIGEMFSGELWGTLFGLNPMHPVDSYNQVKKYLGHVQEVRDQWWTRNFGNESELREMRRANRRAAAAAERTAI